MSNSFSIDHYKNKNKQTKNLATPLRSSISQYCRIAVKLPTHEVWTTHSINVLFDNFEADVTRDLFTLGRKLKMTKEIIPFKPSLVNQ